VPETITSCPLCEADKNSLFKNIQFRGHDVSYKVCDDCGFVFQSPRMSKTELVGFYADEYRLTYQGVEGPNQKDIRIQKKRAAKLLDFVKGSVPRVTSHLDIGSSTGILLEVFKEQYDCLAVGVEPGDSYRDHARSKGLTVFQDIEEVKSEAGEQFELVSMAHVLEHIPDPVAYLSELRDQLFSPGGCLLIEVPNLYAHDSFEIAHMSAFSEHSLQQTLNKAGFSVIAFIKNGNPRSDLLPLYLTVLAKPGYEETAFIVKSEKFVQQKRRLGMFARRIVQKMFPNKAWKAL